MPKCTTSGKNVYKHLNQEERELIMIGLARELKQYQIAELIGRHPSSISREIRRNRLVYNTVYRAVIAQEKANKRKILAHKRERLRSGRIRAFVIRRLQEGWTPEQIAGAIRYHIKGAKTNYESIYQFIYIKRRDLIKYLVRKHRIRKNRAILKGDRRGKIPNKTMIDQRPAIVDRRTRTGDWEFDTIVSRKSKAILAVLRERTTHLVKIQRLPDSTSEQVKLFLINQMKHLPRNLRRTLTFDNGHENAQHQAISKKANIDIYFCNPYHSWEKGSVENTNGLIRRYFPKKTDLSLLSNYEIFHVERKLNNRPRKSLGFRTPNEMFNIALNG